MVQNLTVHWHSCRALLCDLQEATQTNTQGKLTIAWCPDHVVVGRTRSAHAGAPSGMLFIEQKGQKVHFLRIFKNKQNSEMKRRCGPPSGGG